MIDPILLIREPYRTFSGYVNENVKYFTSPNGLFHLVISHCWEYRMGSNACLFNLVSNEEKIIEDFIPHTTNGIVKWSEDSNFIACRIGDRYSGVLIMNLISHKFSFIQTRCNNFIFQNSSIVFNIPDRELDLYNTDKVVGGRKNELPRVKYGKPPDAVIQLSALVFQDKDKLAKINELPTEIGEIRLDPIEDGFWPFDGKFPSNTWDGFNGREFEVYQLEAFAKFGDAQSIKWLNEIKSMPDKKFNNGTRVSFYLGNRERD
jgi:hypothetical protein